ncbi:MAG: LysM peptidoglycan-binding domain-containing protein [Bacteroidota bacterium]
MLALLLAGAPAPVGAQTVAEQVEALVLETRVRRALADQPSLHPLDLTVSATTAGAVTLRGAVDRPEQLERAREVAQAVRGVTSVESLLIVSGRARVSSTSRIPPTPPAPTEEVYHTVQPGDVLGNIARRYGVAVEEIRRLNQLSSSTIRVGQRLRIR